MQQTPVESGSDHICPDGIGLVYLHVEPMKCLEKVVYFADWKLIHS